MTFALFRLWNIRLQLHFTQGPLNWQINIFPSRLLDVSVSGCNQNNFVQMDLFFFFHSNTLSRAGLAGLHDPQWMYVLMQCSWNCWLRPLKTPGGTKRDCLVNSRGQRAASTLLILMLKVNFTSSQKHAYVTPLMGFCDWPRVSG